VVISFAVLAAVVAFGCESHDCTEIGCSDVWSLTLRNADGAPPTYGVVLDIDGTNVVCPAVSLDMRYATCADSVSIQLDDEVVCTERETEDGKSQSCNPTGRFETRVIVQGTPAEVVATLSDGGTVTDERTFTPRYVETQPNGPECPPFCREASDRWDLP